MSLELEVDPYNLLSDPGALWGEPQFLDFAEDSSNTESGSPLSSLATDTEDSPFPFQLEPQLPEINGLEAKRGNEEGAQEKTGNLALGELGVDQANGGAAVLQSAHTGAPNIYLPAYQNYLSQLQLLNPYSPQFQLPQFQGTGQMPMPMQMQMQMPMQVPPYFPFGSQSPCQIPLAPTPSPPKYQTPDAQESPLEKTNLNEIDKQETGAAVETPANQYQPKKKRKLDSNTTSITLPREDLLSYTSEEFEQFVSDITEKRDLTTSDQNELKRQRRLIKNRESAHASRLRKKSHLETLEKQVSELMRENGNLKNNITALMQENSNLKSEVILLKSGKSGNPSSIWGANYFTPFARPPMTSGVTLFVLLFTFGLFVNVPLGYQKPVVPYGTMSPMRVLDRDDFKAASQEGNVLSVLAEQKEIPVHRLEKAYRRHLEANNQKIEIDLLPPKQISCPSPETVMATLPKHFPLKANTSVICDDINQILSTKFQQYDDCVDQQLVISLVFPLVSEPIPIVPQTNPIQDTNEFYEVLCNVKP